MVLDAPQDLLRCSFLPWVVVLSHDMTTSPASSLPHVFARSRKETSFLFRNYEYGMVLSSLAAPLRTLLARCGVVFSNSSIDE